MFPNKKTKHTGASIPLETMKHSPYFIKCLDCQEKLRKWHFSTWHFSMWYFPKNMSFDPPKFLTCFSHRFEISKFDIECYVFPPFFFLKYVHFPLKRHPIFNVLKLFAPKMQKICSSPKMSKNIFPLPLKWLGCRCLLHSPWGRRPWKNIYISL